MTRASSWGWWFAVVLMTATAAVAQVEDEGFTARVDLGGQYDDNVSLASGQGDDPVQDDIVFRIKPQASYVIYQKDNRFRIGGDIDWRKGSDTALNELNAGVDGEALLVHPAGWRARLYEDFDRRTFDQALTFNDVDLVVAEPGVTRQLSSVSGIDASYTPRRRFTLSGGYEYTYQDFQFDQLGGDDRRTRQAAKGRVQVPVVGDFQLYGQANYNRQDALERVEFEYEDVRYAGGVQWEAPSEYVVFAEAGYQEIDFLSTAGTEFDGVVARAGFVAPVSEETSVRAWVGRNGYDEINFMAEIAKSWEGQRLRVAARKTTENSFSISTIGRTYEGTVFSADFDKALWTRWTAYLEASYFRLESNGLTSLTNDTYNAAFTLVYAFRDDIGIGLRGRYSERDSSDPVQSFDNSRAFLFVRYTFE